jgi:hypothetical protein
VDAATLALKREFRAALGSAVVQAAPSAIAAQIDKAIGGTLGRSAASLLSVGTPVDALCRIGFFR